MPGLLTQSTPFRTITIKELHPSFGAEIQDVDFQNMSDEQFQEIKAAMAKVCRPSSPIFLYSPRHSTASLFFATLASLTPSMSNSPRALASSITCEGI